MQDFLLKKSTGFFQNSMWKTLPYFHKKSVINRLFEERKTQFSTKSPRKSKQESGNKKE